MSSRPPEREELDGMLEPLLQFAQDMLRRRGEFYPFAATIGVDGQLNLNAADTGSQHPPSQEVLELLADGMRAQASTGQIRAAAFCYDVRFTGADGKQTDAIAVALEHKAGDAALVMLPYSKGRLSGLRFGELIAAPPAERRVFRAG